MTFVAPGFAAEARARRRASRPASSVFLRALLMELLIWRKRVGVEPTIRAAKDRIAGFEDRESHRTPFASVAVRQSHYKV